MLISVYHRAVSASTSNLTELRLDECNVEGVLPGWIREIRSLETLTVTECNLTELSERFVYVHIMVRNLALPLWSKSCCNSLEVGKMSRKF